MTKIQIIKKKNIFIKYDIEINIIEITFIHINNYENKDINNQKINDIKMKTKNNDNNENDEFQIVQMIEKKRSTYKINAIKSKSYLKNAIKKNSILQRFDKKFKSRSILSTKNFRTQKNKIISNSSTISSQTIQSQRQFLISLNANAINIKKITQKIDQFLKQILNKKKIHR